MYSIHSEARKSDVMRSSTANEGQKVSFWVVRSSGLRKQLGARPDDSAASFRSAATDKFVVL